MPQGQLVASTPGEGPGFLVAPRVVRTAAHVLAPAPDLVLQKSGRLERHLTAALTAEELLAEFATIDQLIAREAQASRELTHKLLASVEEHTGLPSIASGLAYGLHAPLVPSVERARHWADLLIITNSYEGASKTLQHLSAIIEVKGPRSTAELAQVREALAEAEQAIRDITATDRQVLNLHVDRHYEFLGVVPQHDTSPCGVLRLAVPIVPGAPGIRSWTDQTTMTLAA
ncbi:hypothetical protein QF034_000033 [Streptomyces africanus]|uniref:Uncharacterized protein n=1 Tax=Streptomyces africanus TaxID=231024 RepID=A0ABU0QEJ0_9ACTN|nr:hypothetical protein [Streptomyces africanus]MDQ0745802.1 hypothetical protein [Streptomyces africanus]